MPDTLTSALRLTRFPPLPELPEPLRGKALVSITLAFAGDEAEGNALVAPLRAVAAPSTRSRRSRARRWRRSPATRRGRCRESATDTC